MADDNKGLRLLKIQDRLNNGEVIKKKELVNEYNIWEKTVQRDIEQLRCYIEQKSAGSNTIVYDSKEYGYKLAE